MCKIIATLLCGMLLMSSMVMVGTGLEGTDDGSSNDSFDLSQYCLGGLLDPNGIREGPNTRIISPEELLAELPGDSPAAVDNSAGLPPVGHQQTQASCSAWAIGYYHATYIENQENPCDLTDPNNQVSPAFLYNIANAGYNGGSDMNDVADLIINNGVCSMAEMPYDTGDYTSWPDQDWIWVSGMKRRAESKTWLDISKKTGMDALKAYLAAGNTAVTHIQVWSNFDYIHNFNYTYCTSEKYGSDRGGHSVAICGYDDTKVTADGVGALKMVNSWGTGWGDAGFWWMSYQTIKDNTMCYGRALYLTSLVDYEPSLVAKVNIQHDFRGDLVKDEGITVSVNEGGPTLGSKPFLCCPEIEYYYGYYGYEIQKYPFPSGKMAFDISEFIPSMDSASDHEFTLSLDNKEATTGTLKSFEMLNAGWWEGNYSRNMPMAIGASTVTAASFTVTSGVFDHMPIRIDSDPDLEHQAIGEFWEGDGSVSNPFGVHDYLINGSGYGGCIFLGNTTLNFMIENCYLHNASNHYSWPYFYESGVQLYNARNGAILNNNISNNVEGILLYLSHDTLLDGNEIKFNALDAVIVWESENNTLARNFMGENGWGLTVNFANNNVIKENTIINTEWGILMASSIGNHIYHNNFINITNPTETGTSLWDNGYPSGGNYWSDYLGLDAFSGPGQDVPGADGIGDSPYTFDFAQDNYPLMTPWVPPPLSSFNVTLAAGWNLVSIPLEPEDDSIGGLLTPISGQYDIALSYDSADPADPWKSYRPGAPSNDMTSMDNTIALWIHVTGACDLPVLGYAPATTNIILRAGWNLVGYPSATDRAVSDALAGTGYDRVEAFDPMSPYLITEVDGSYTMTSGEGYWVHVPADTVWSVDW